jgi:anti-sigma-K factor RskA
VLTARDAVMLDAKVRTGGTAAVVMSRRERALVFAATGLRVLPSSKGYELWLIGPGGDTPTGMLPAPREGRTGPVIAAGLKSGERLGLSVEPAGGSNQPTSPMILELAL